MSKKIVIFALAAILTLLLVFFKLQSLPENTTQTSLESHTRQEELASPNSPQISKDSLYLLINAMRKSNQLPELAPDARLEASAQLKLADMLQNKYFRHEDLDKRTSWHFFKQTGYDYLTAGENLAFAQTSPWQIISHWEQSQTHKEQILNSDYIHMGLAIDCKTLEKNAGSGCITVLHLGSI